MTGFFAHRLGGGKASGNWWDRNIIWIGGSRLFTWHRATGAWDIRNLELDAAGGPQLRPPSHWGVRSGAAGDWVTWLGGVPRQRLWARLT